MGAADLKQISIDLVNIQGTWELFSPEENAG